MASAGPNYGVESGGHVLLSQSHDFKGLNDGKRFVILELARKMYYCQLSSTRFECHGGGGDELAYRSLLSGGG